MARVNAPLFGFSASGSIADTLTFASWKGRDYARQKVTPANPNSAGQQLTRNTFKFLNALWQYMPAAALDAWNLYGVNNRYTARNGWIARNNGPLRTETDLLLMIPSPAAGGGIPAASVSAAAVSLGTDVTITAPSLPTGWTITAGHALAVRNVDPQTSEVYDVGYATDLTTPYVCQITGLTAAVEYVVGGWFEYVKDNAETAYGIALVDTVTPTV